MKHFWSGGLALLVLVAASMLMLSRRNAERKQLAQPEPPHHEAPIAEVVATNASASVVPVAVDGLVAPVKTLPPFEFSGGKPYHLGQQDMDASRSNALRVVLETKINPALSNWCRTYAGYLPFQPEALRVEDLAGQMGRGTRNSYTFKKDGCGLTFFDIDGTFRLCYFASPKMTALQQSTDAEPILSHSITRDELARLAKEDTGRAFAPSDIRMTPTGQFSAMNGGTWVEVGGDPNNSLSWNLHQVFGPDGKLSYYQRGLEQR